MRTTTRSKTYRPRGSAAHIHHTEPWKSSAVKKRTKKWCVFQNVS